MIVYYVAIESMIMNGCKCYTGISFRLEETIIMIYTTDNNTYLVSKIE